MLQTQFDPYISLEKESNWEVKIDIMLLKFSFSFIQRTASKNLGPMNNMLIFLENFGPKQGNLKKSDNLLPHSPAWSAWSLPRTEFLSLTSSLHCSPSDDPSDGT